MSPELVPGLLIRQCDKVALAAAATRHFFLHFVCKKQTVTGLSGYNVRMPADALAKDTFRSLEHLSMPEGPPKPFRLWVPEGIYKAWTKFMWTSPLDVGESSKVSVTSIVTIFLNVLD